MKLFKDYKINECQCSMNYCDEWETNLDCEFYLTTPEKFTLFGEDFTIDRILVEPTFCGLNDSYTTIEDYCCLKLATESEKFECIQVPKKFIKEIADIFKKLEKVKDKRLNGCFISDDFYEYLEEGK